MVGHAVTQSERIGHVDIADPLAGVVMFPVITGATGAERIYDGYPDVALEIGAEDRPRESAGRERLIERRDRRFGPYSSDLGRSCPFYLFNVRSWLRDGSGERPDERLVELRHDLVAGARRDDGCTASWIVRQLALPA